MVVGSWQKRRRGTVSKKRRGRLKTENRKRLLGGKGRGEREYSKERRKETHIVPVRLGELDGRGSPLDAGAVDEDVDLAAHGVERLLEEALDALEVGEVALDGLDGAAGGGEGGGGLVVGGAGAADEADVRACLCEGDSAGCADTWERGRGGREGGGRGSKLWGTQTRGTRFCAYRGWRL